MSASSAQQTRPFEGLHWVHVLLLIDLVRTSKLRSEPHIEKRYKERATHFTETIAFLSSIGLVKKRDERIFAEESICNIAELKLGSIVLESVLRQRSRYRNAIVRYLKKFCLSNGKVWYRSDDYSRSADSAVRNFLMEMGVIVFSPEEQRYFLTPENISFYVNAKDTTVYLPNRIAVATAEHEELGLAAEKMIMQLEKERLGESMADKVEHVALRNAAAGYDVLSVTMTKNTTAPRYIEVKAVPARTFQFYWTKNEVNVARLLGSLYFLYLLPVQANGNFIRDKLTMINNPCTAVLDRDDIWTAEPNVLLCRPKLIKSLGS